MFSFLSWIILGALVGWLAGLVMGTGRHQGLINNIIVGIIGSFVGGLLYNLFTGRGFSFDFQFTWDLGSIFVAFVGASVFIAVLRLLRRG